MEMLRRDLHTVLRDYPDFPKPGIIFKDMCPVLRDPVMLKRVVRAMADVAHSRGAEQIVGIESRGFILGVPLALELGLPFVPARKKGKLPGQVVTQGYELEYGHDYIEVQKDSFASAQKNFVVDDLLATGGTATAVGALIQSLEAEVVGFGFLMVLGFLNGSEKILKACPNAHIEGILTL